MKMLKSMYRTLHFLGLLSVFPCSMYGQWESLGSGIDTSPRAYFSISVVDSQTVWAVPFNTNFTASAEYVRTVDGGKTWVGGELSGVDGYFPGNVFALSADIAWIIMIQLPNQDRIRIFHTQDGGVNWEEQTGMFNNAGHAFAALHFFDFDHGIGFGSPGTGSSATDSLQIFRTVDGGDTWGRIPSSELPTPLPDEGVWVYSGNCSYESSGDTLWFGSRAGRVFRTTDRGETWSAFATGISGSVNDPGVHSIAFQDHLQGIAVSFTKEAARTTDGGESWSIVTPPADINYGGIEFIPGTNDTYLIYDGLNASSNLLITRDAGETWITESHSPSMNCVQFISPEIGFGGGRVVIANDDGLYKWTGDFGGMLPSSTRDTVAGSIELFVYPNPLSSSLYIRNTSQIDIRQAILYNTLGQRIRAFNVHNKEGLVYLNMEDVPEGIYQLALLDDELRMISVMNLMVVHR